MGKNTPSSAFSDCRNLLMRVRKMLQLRRSACGMADAQFLSRLRQRYCLMAAANFSEVANTSPEFSSRILSSSNARTYSNRVRVERRFSKTGHCFWVYFT